ncbi:MAG: alpha/beta hydrolase [Betaproteobacteria bacterium]
MNDSPVLTPEFCERGYNNRAAVPDHADYFRRWADDSAEVRAQLACEIDLRYGARPKETMDLFPAGGARGLLVFIHGGYWRALDKSDHSFVVRPFVAAGYDAACLNYDLCPSVDIATIVDECRNAIAWLVQHGAEHRVASKNMVISGHSAGGHLAAMMHATDWRARDVDSGAIRGGVSISGVFDLEPLIHTSMNLDLRLSPASAAAVSPVRMQPALAVPFLLAVGSIETSEFLRQSQLLWEAWPGVRPAGDNGPVLLDGHHHFSAVDYLADSGDRLYRETVRLFDPATAAA